MKVIQNKQYKFLLYFSFLIVFVNSCSSQNQSNQKSQKIEISEKNYPTENEIDAKVKLKFSTGIRAILEDSKGNFWFGSHEEGVCLFDGKKMHYFTMENGLSSNQIRSIFEDSKGRIWFEGGEGISSYDGGKIITHTNKNYDSKNEWKTNENDLWFKGDESIGYNVIENEFGVYRYDGTALKYYVLPIAQMSDKGFVHSISTPFVRGENGRLWFGSYNAVIGYDGTDFIVISNESLNLNDLTGYLHVRSIFEDSKGNLWIGNNGIGVLLYDGNTTINFSELQGLVPFSSSRNGMYSPPNTLEHVFAIGEDLQGNMWFGDRDTGAWKYDGKSMKNYTKEDGLSTTHIWQIYNTTKGELWFAMADGTVLEFNGKSFERVF